MNMIDLYVNEVVQRLPQKMRADIGKELRSLIEDTLEDRSQAGGRPVDRDMEIAVLKEMGSPAKVAASYLPPRYLIGPQLFPTYLSTLRIVISVVAVLAAIGLGVSLATSTGAASNMVDLLVRIFGGLFSAVFQAAAIVTVIFAVIQFTSPDLKELGLDKPWDPREMKPRADEDRVKLPDHIGEIVGGVLALLIFNVYPQWVGFSTLQGSDWVHAPVLTAAFFRFLPFLNVIWAVEIGRSVALLSQGRWSPGMRWVSVAISAATIVINGLMLLGPDIVALDPAAFSRMGWGVISADQIQVSNQAFANSVRIIMGITIVVEAVHLLGHLYRLLVKGRLAEAI